MTATLSMDGQIVLPREAILKLGLRPGAHLDCSIERGEIVLRPQETATAKIVKSDLTGLPAILPPAGAPPLTPDIIKAALADFP
jgi:bifunctional DNA-binding transcriptional regulator/antitoxin component of YhaV-PrlF toxin-antitoxin module